jgi:hypothetical protein
MISVRRTTSGGKAGKGHNRSASFYVLDENFTTEKMKAGLRAGKYFRFAIGDLESVNTAAEKAEAWVDEREKWETENEDKK